MLCGIINYNVPAADSYESVKNIRFSNVQIVEINVL